MLVFKNKQFQNFVFSESCSEIHLQQKYYSDEVACGSKPGCELLYVNFLVDGGKCRSSVETAGEKS